MDIENIREKILRGEYRFTIHATERSLERGKNNHWVPAKR